MTTIVDDLDCPTKGWLTVSQSRNGISVSFTRVAAVFVLAITTFSAYPAVAFGQVSDFVIDPTQSYLTMSGTLTSPYSGTLTEQFPGSLTTQLSGDILANVWSDMGSLAYISVPEAFQVQMSTHATPAMPGNNPAVFAAQASNVPIPGQTSYEEFWNSDVQISGWTTAIPSGVIPQSLINFVISDAAGLLLAPGVVNGEASFSGHGPSTAGPATIQPYGAGERLVIPLTFNGGAINQSLSFSGQIVAVTTTPSTQLPPPGVQVLSLPTNGLVYDKQNGELYASTPVSPGHPTGTLTQINPATGAIGAVYDMAGTPGQLVISDDASTIYAVTDGGAIVRQFDVNQGIEKLHFALPSVGQTQLLVKTISAIPGQPDAVLISQRNPTELPGSAGTSIYVNGVALPNGIGSPTTSGGPDITTTDPTGKVMYGTDIYTPQASLWTASVTDTGLLQTSLGDMYSIAGSGRIVAANGMLFTDQTQYTGLGVVVNIASGQKVGTFEGGSNFVLDFHDNRLLSVATTTNGVVIYAYDLTSLALIGSEFLFISPLFSAQTNDLTVWGSDGLAFHDQNNVYIVQTSLVPEPSTFVPATIGAVALLAFGRRRFPRIYASHPS